MIASDTQTQIHKHMTNMTNTLTPKKQVLLDLLHDMESWERINSFVVLIFEDANTRRRVLKALDRTPMDADHIEWCCIVDSAIRNFL